MRIKIGPYCTGNIVNENVSKVEEETVSEQELEQKLNSPAACYGLLTIQIKMDGPVRIRRMIDQEF